MRNTRMEKKSVEDKLRDGDYKTKLPYVVNRVDPKGHKAYRADQSRLQDQFRTDALVELKLLELSTNEEVLFKHPKAELLWDKAWDRGHHGGLAEVWNEIQDLKDLID